ncbi:hypothetical protein SRB5_11990 [Streptomyces sp. RB5]|uniref:Transposase IS110-like N-terminal domain-containing protein n=1 Tax=Streptomyces smaragdinus TaxID=2585196 RepID=A0A7K0CCA5_9ACTN|nr:hypothetical protein [Streptomyces smaragdinus]
MTNDSIDVYLGLDVGKGEHHATALTPSGKTVLDKRLPNTEPKLREIFAKLQAKHGRVLVIVDQPASIGALPMAVGRTQGCRIAYLPGLTMRRIADLYPGETKTDARDTHVIADAARTMPHTLRSIELADRIARVHPAMRHRSETSTRSRSARCGRPAVYARARTEAEAAGRTPTRHRTVHGDVSPHCDPPFVIV